MDMLKKAIIKGPSEHPGANYIIRQDGVKIRLDYVADRTIIADSLSPGFIVERHLRDGDIAIFNRQPSLHRMSVMSHFVRVLPNRTFRLHPAVCPPYNADFDGDEMNIHIPQSEEARSEAITLMKVQDQILSPRYGGPIIGAIRDFITAAYLLTKNDTLLPKDVFTDLALAAGYSGPLPKPEVKTPKPLYSGLQLFSLNLPNDFNYVMSSKWSQGGKSTTEQDVVIKNGELKKGIIDRAAIGAEEPDSILHRISKDYGTGRSREFLNSTLSMLRAFITRYGFSYGFDELELTPKAQNNVNLEMDNAYQRVANHIDLYEKGTLPLTRGLSAEEVLEFSIMNELATARDKAGRIADKNFDMKNAGMIMARTGARGSSLNVGQMTAALGQQSVRGERIKKGYQNRALTHFKRDDNSPDSRGFVKSNYRTGLNPTEFFFHAMGGREGLVDTAVRTQQSGYMQRRLINALEHIKVEYDLTVRDPDGNIIQFLYGEDGIDPAKSDHGKAVNVKRLADTEAILEGITKEKVDVESILKKYKNEFNPKMLQTLRDTFKSTTLSKKTVSKIVKKTSDLLVKATVEPGEASGIVAAQSIGEPGTQMTLRTFHFAGVKEQDVTLGLPRLIELVDARKQPATPSMTVYLDKVHRVSKDKTLEVGKEILFTKVADLVDKTVIEYEQGIRIILSAKKLAERKTDVEQVGAVLKTGKRKVEVVENNTVIVTLEDADLATLFALKNKLMKVRVKGIPGVTRITVTKRNNEWFIQTTGSNLAKVLKINGVDLTKTTTNNITEIGITLGIEAARQAMVNEITSTLEEQGLEVDIRHILLVADLMTSKGSIQSIGRHGIAGKKASVLARAAFEITVPTIATAAISGEVERLKGVTENVIVGLPIPLGTGMIDIFMKG
jgi:DNA-directed RNA polymerase subunit A'